MTVRVRPGVVCRLAATGGRAGIAERKLAHERPLFDVRLLILIGDVVTNDPVIGTVTPSDGNARGGWFTGNAGLPEYVTLEAALAALVEIWEMEQA